MTGGGAIELEGLDKLLKALKKCDRDVVDAALDGLNAAGWEIIGDAVKNLQRNGNWVTGLLAQSGHSERRGDDVTAGFFDTTNRTGYAEYVEYGRRAGKFPPIDEMMAWAYKKFHMKDWKEARTAGFLIARKIAEKGSEPHPLFEPAVKKNHNSIIKAVREAVRRKTK
jgi:hypothetical protein